MSDVGEDILMAHSLQFKAAKGIMYTAWQLPVPQQTTQFSERGFQA